MNKLTLALLATLVAGIAFSAEITTTNVNVQTKSSAVVTNQIDSITITQMLYLMERDVVVVRVEYKAAGVVIATGTVDIRPAPDVDGVEMYAITVSRSTGENSITAIPKANLTALGLTDIKAGVDQAAATIGALVVQ